MKTHHSKERAILEQPAKSFDMLSGLQETGFDRIEKKIVKSGRVVLATEVGGRDGENEDALLFDTEADTFVVADGMGGYDHGALAAKITCQEISHALATGVKSVEAHENIFKRMRQSGIDEGGAAYVAGKIKGDSLRLWLGGDCSFFLFDSNGELVDSKCGRLKDAPRAVYPGRAEKTTYPLQNYYRLLLVSDGITDNVTAEDIVQNAKGRIDSVLKNLAALAMKGMHGDRGDGSLGNPDNITAILYEILPTTLRGK